MIVMACIIPFSIKFTQKDNLPKLVELKEEDDDEDGELKVIILKNYSSNNSNTFVQL